VTDHADEWINRARALLSPERTGLTLKDAPPDPTPDEIGATAGFGLAAEDCDLLVSVYVFEEWGQGQLHLDGLSDRGEAQDRKTLAIVNGCLLIFATSGSADEDEFALYDLSSCLSRPS
jgi:hypothetical protein